MRLLPFESETIVLASNTAQLCSLLRKLTQTRAEETDEKLFVGFISEEYFAISLRVTKPQSFIPQVLGTVHSTTSGCLLFLKYKFFSSTNGFFGFWCIASLVLAGFFFGVAGNYTYGAVSLLACLANYLIAMANFDIHLRDTRKKLYNALEQLT